MEIEELAKIFADAGVKNIVWDVSPQVQAVIDHPDYAKVDQDVLDKAAAICKKLDEKYKRKA